MCVYIIGEARDAGVVWRICGCLSGWAPAATMLCAAAAVAAG